jgi:hypothetical protein
VSWREELPPQKIGIDPMRLPISDQNTVEELNRM